MSGLLETISVEVRQAGPAADLLDPDVLNARKYGIQIGLRDDHLRGKGFLIPIPLPVEIGEENYGLVSGLRRLESLGGCAGAPEVGVREHDRRVPPNPLSGQASIEQPRRDIGKATEAAPRVNEVRQDVGTAAGELHLTVS